MYSLLIRNRLPVLHYPIYTQIPVAPITQKINITQVMPTQVGLIWGISVDVQGVTPLNQALITLADSQALYLTLRQGSSDFVLDLRLTNTVFTQDAAGVTALNPYRFLSVNIPGNISLDQSFYSNPTSIATGAFIKLNLWYCTWANLKYLESKGQIMPPPGQPGQPKV